MSKCYASVKVLINGENVSHCLSDDVGSAIKVCLTVWNNNDEVLRRVHSLTLMCVLKMLKSHPVTS